MKNPGWIRISILTDLLLGSRSHHPRRSCVGHSGKRWHAATTSRRHRRRGRRIPDGATTARRGRYALYRIRKCGGTGRPSARSDRKNGSPSTVLVFPAGGPFSETPLAWQAVADFPYRNSRGLRVASSTRPSDGASGTNCQRARLHRGAPWPRRLLPRHLPAYNVVSLLRHLLATMSGPPWWSADTRAPKSSPVCITRSLAPDVLSETGRSGIPVGAAWLGHRNLRHPFALLNWACRLARKCLPWGCAGWAFVRGAPAEFATEWLKRASSSTVRKLKCPRGSLDQGGIYEWVSSDITAVGRTGLEPVTPCASCKCATNCANGPSRTTLPPGHLAPGSETRR